jgi:long-chain acyl-CoA synthetase
MPSPAYRSFADMISRRVTATPDREAFRAPTDPGWASLTWRQVGERVRAIACGLRARGLQNEERCALLATTSVDWILADFGIMSAGGATTTVYPSMTPEECAFIMNDAACRFAFVEDRVQLEKLIARRAELPHLEKVFVMKGAPPEHDWAVTFDELSEQGRAWDTRHPGEYEAVVRSPTPQSLATLLYTSGTTGRPKGVELLHDCWIYEAEAIEALRLLHPEDLQYLWLPLSHSFGKVLEAAQVHIGFATAVEGRIDKMIENLAEVRPTFVAAVPRVFEKVHNRVVMGAREAGGAKLRIFNWAMGVGHEVSRLTRAGKAPGMRLKLAHRLAHRLVFAKLHERFGGRLRFFVSGSAPLSLEVAEFFHAADILIAEGYGLTETSAASFVNVPERFKLGTVGRPLPGTAVKIAPEDGEILLRGRGIMRGYHKLPDVTRESIAPDGWLATGDIGFLDADGFLTITDRKKDLIKTSGGKYIAPQALESRFKAICPFVSQIVVHGNNRNFCAALITLDEDATRRWARDKGIGDCAIARLAGDSHVQEMIQGYVDRLNATLASYETIKRFALLPADFSVESGELTASLKVKRKLVEQKYRTILDGLYSQAKVVGT